MAIARIMKNKIHWGTGWPMMEDTYGKVHPSDSELWLRLWMLASHKDMNLAAIIQYLRNCGCRLDRINGTFGIRPDSMAEADYSKERKALEPYRGTVVKILQELGKENI